MSSDPTKYDDYEYTVIYSEDGNGDKLKIGKCWFFSEIVRTKDSVTREGVKARLIIESTRNSARIEMEFEAPHRDQIACMVAEESARWGRLEQATAIEEAMAKAGIALPDNVINALSGENVR